MKNISEEIIDERIERVIGSVAAKKKDMALWDTSREKESIGKALLKKRWIISSAAAAVLVTIVAVGYLRFVTYSNDNLSPIHSDRYESGLNTSFGGSLYRGSSVDISEIEKMIKDSRYEDALQAINGALADTVIEKGISQERYDYQRKLIDYRNYELKWLKISTLLKLGSKDEAESLLLNYVNEGGDHKVDAQKLLKELKK